MNNSLRDFLDFVVDNVSRDFEIEIDEDYKSSIISMYKKPISKKKIPSPSKDNVKRLNSPKVVKKGKAEVHKCERIPKNSTTVCGHNAKNEVDGKWYCGTKNSGCYRAILNKLKKQENTTGVNYPTKSSFEKGSSSKLSPTRNSLKKSERSNSSPLAKKDSPVKKSPQRSLSARKDSPYPTKSSFSKPKTGLAAKKEEKDIKSKALASSVNRSQKTILRGITIDGDKYYHNPKLNVVYNDDKEAIGLLSKDKSSIEELDDETERILTSSGVTIKRYQQVDPDEDDNDINLEEDDEIDIPDSEDDEDADISDEDIDELDINSSSDDEEIDDIEDD